MKSTDNNINNPLKVNTVDLLRKVESWEFTKVLYVPEWKYRDMNQHDPHTIYIITDKHNGDVYYGDLLVTANGNNTPRYFLGINDNDENVIYMHTNGCFMPFFGKMHRTSLSRDFVEVARYENAQQAYNTLRVLNNVGDHDSRFIKLYNHIISYINKDISCHELVMFMINESYFRNIKDVPVYQNFLHILVLDGANNCQADISNLLKEDLGRWTSPNYYAPDDNNWEMYVLMNMYSDLYNVVVEFNFFKDKRYHDASGDINLSVPIHKIGEIYRKYLNIPFLNDIL